MTQEGKDASATVTDGLKLFDAFEGQKNCAVTSLMPQKVSP